MSKPRQPSTPGHRAFTAEAEARPTTLSPRPTRLPRSCSRSAPGPASTAPGSVFGSQNLKLTPGLLLPNLCLDAVLRGDPQARGGRQGSRTPVQEGRGAVETGGAREPVICQGHRLPPTPSPPGTPRCEHREHQRLGEAEGTAPPRPAPTSHTRQGTPPAGSPPASLVFHSAWCDSTRRHAV